MKTYDKSESSSEEENPIPDFDTGDVSKLFKMCEPSDEIHIGNQREYVLQLVFNGNNILVSSGSKGSVSIYQMEEQRFTPVSTIPKGLNDSLSLACSLKFDPVNQNILYCTREDGFCYCYDLRMHGHVYTFSDDSTGSPKPFTCMDINKNGRMVCCGTEKILADSFLLFFDTRQRSLLGGYWESHDDDITDIKFHPTNPDTMLSCSTDGLLNVFDLKQNTEDDALIKSLNTENSASTLTWFRSNNADHVGCLTHTNDFQIYNVESQDKELEFKRDYITKSMLRNSHADCYLIDCHAQDNLADIFLLATSNFNRG